MNRCFAYAVRQRCHVSLLLVHTGLVGRRHNVRNPYRYRGPLPVSRAAFTLSLNFSRACVSSA
jgi:hypothetical protein